jgi:hypothetical protein
MRKVILLLLSVVILSFMSCIDTNNTEFEHESQARLCICGTIVDDGIDTEIVVGPTTTVGPYTYGSSSTHTRYWIEVRNECSGKIKRFNLSIDAWYKAFVGTRWCSNMAW